MVNCDSQPGRLLSTKNGNITLAVYQSESSSESSDVNCQKCHIGNLWKERIQFNSCCEHPTT